MKIPKYRGFCLVLPSSSLLFSSFRERERSTENESKLRAFKREERECGRG